MNYDYEIGLCCGYGPELAIALHVCSVTESGKHSIVLLQLNVSEYLICVNDGKGWNHVA